MATKKPRSSKHGWVSPEDLDELESSSIGEEDKISDSPKRSSSKIPET